MNKADLIDKIVSRTGISKGVAATAVSTTMDSLADAIKKGDRVRLIGFGTFSMSQSKPRSGRNPQTGQPIKIVGKPIRIQGRFATPYDTGKALGIPKSRVNTLINRAKQLTFGDEGYAPRSGRDAARGATATKMRSSTKNAKFKKSRAKVSSKTTR